MSYRPRHIKFKELLALEDWFIKVYSITKHDRQINPEFYDIVKRELPHWLQLTNSFNSQHQNIGFLILHAGTEGIFSLINWWVGDNMLNTHIFKTDYNTMGTFEKISGDGLAPCIWELEVINHERIAWTDHILKKTPNPNFKMYLNTTFSVSL